MISIDWSERYFVVFSLILKIIILRVEVGLLNTVFGLQRWINNFKEKNCTCFGVNSHNKGSIREVISKFSHKIHVNCCKLIPTLTSKSCTSMQLINFVRARIKELKAGDSSYTATVMLVGIPNVGKSAIANAMHQIGRITAEGMPV